MIVNASNSLVPHATLPPLEHVPLTDWQLVYEPAEDTYLLCDALAQDVSRFYGATLIVEVGPGSGTVSSCLLDLLRGGNGGSRGSAAPPAVVIAVDVSPHACRVTRETARAAGVSSRLDIVQADLLGPLVQRLRGAVDIFLFNPPYVPTPLDEVPLPGAELYALGCGGEDSLPAAWAGGEDGRVVIDRALHLCAATLRRPTKKKNNIINNNNDGDSGWDSGGVAYWVLVEENRPNDVMARLQADGLETKIVASRRAANERLHILRITWPLLPQ